jgi:arsenate reductase
MSRVVLYHNPKCSKSRGALEILQARGVDLQIVEYLTTPLGREDLEDLLDKLPEPPSELVRKDAHFKELGLDADRCTDRGAVVEVLLEHPRLMQRPVAVRADRAVIGRPSERVLEIVD